VGLYSVCRTGRRRSQAIQARSGPCSLRSGVRIVGSANSVHANSRFSVGYRRCRVPFRPILTGSDKEGADKGRSCYGHQQRTEESSDRALPPCCRQNKCGPLRCYIAAGNLRTTADTSTAPDICQDPSPSLWSGYSNQSPFTSGQGYPRCQADAGGRRGND